MKLRIPDGEGTLIWEHAEGNIIYIEQNDGASYSVHPLAPRLADAAFEAVLLEPEQREIDDLTLIFYGIGADYQQYRDFAQEIAKQGMPVVLHKRPKARPLPSVREIHHSDKREELIKSLTNPYVFNSEVGVALADAATEYASGHLHAPYNGLLDYAHSKGGLDAIIHANYDERTKFLVNDATSGKVRKLAMWNHVESVVPILKDAKSIIETIPEEDLAEIKEQFGQSKMQLLLEVLNLIAWRPDVTDGLKELKDKDVPVVYITREKDTIFKDSDTKRAAQRLLRKELIREHVRIGDSTHHAPIEKPAEAARLFAGIVAKTLSEA